jgi:hypothetical protein
MAPPYTFLSLFFDFFPRYKFCAREKKKNGSRSWSEISYTILFTDSGKCLCMCLDWSEMKFGSGLRTFLNITPSFPQIKSKDLSTVF